MCAHLRVLLAVAALILLCASGRTATATPLRFFAIDFSSSATTVLHFSEDGALLDTWLSPQSRYAYGITTFGSSLYVSEYSGGIQEYALDGTFIRDVARLERPGGIGLQVIESDVAGNLYTSSANMPAYKLDQEGTLLATYSHSGIWWPRGIDAAANGDVYVLDNGSFDMQIKLHRFHADGSLIDSYVLPEMYHVASMAIDEARNVVYVSTSTEASVFRYDISSGVPVFAGTLPAISNIGKMFVEQQSGRLFTTGVFEVALDGSGATRIFTEPWSMVAVVAIPIPEPATIAMLPFVMIIALKLRTRSR